MFSATVLWLVIIGCFAIIVGALFYLRRAGLFDTQVRVARAVMILASVVAVCAAMVQLAQWMR